MLTWPFRFVLTGIIVLSMFLAGCATGQEWSTWKEHPTHFASGEHLLFSFRNRSGEPPRVKREDVALARTEGWWGKPVTVSTDQILER
jgi:hypothetical protein